MLKCYKFTEYSAYRSLVTELPPNAYTEIFTWSKSNKNPLKLAILVGF